MSEIALYEHQQKSVDEIFEKFEVCNRVLYQLSTGGGKTFVFSFIAKRWSETYGNKIAVLCHRDEIAKQTVKSLNKIGVSVELVTKNTKFLTHKAQVYVCMIESVNNRLKKNSEFLKNIGLVIADECHIRVFEKVYDYFPTAKKLGVTATPVVLQRITFYKCKHCKMLHDELTECCNDEVMEWTKPFTMSMIYEDIVVGRSISELIEDGKLVQEIAIAKEYINTADLKVDSDGEFTTDSQDKAYSNENAVFNVLLNYEEFCKGKKTIIFNSSSHANLLVYQKFVEAGYNAKMFDSVNKEQSGSRAELLKWFAVTPDAILINVNIFTTGFDDPSVQAIIINRATNSLSLYLQMVGRGGRPCDLFYKDNFIFIDGGKNIDRHQMWSDPTRDWYRIFFYGTSKEKEKAKRENIEDVQECVGCGYLMAKTEDICPECGTEFVPKAKRQKTESETVLMPINEIPPPNGEKIYRYTISKNENVNFAWRILIGQIVDMFRYYRVDYATYTRSLETGEFEKKVKRMINKCYFVLISKNDISGGTNRTIKYLVDKIKNKLDSYYGE